MVVNKITRRPCSPAGQQAAASRLSASCDDLWCVAALVHRPSLLEKFLRSALTYGGTQGTVGGCVGALHYF